MVICFNVLEGTGTNSYLLILYPFFSFLVPPVIVPFSFGVKPVNENSFAQLVCVVSIGDEPIQITWSLKGDVVSSDPDLSTTMLGRRTSMLTISSVSYRHIGDYTCRAENPAGVSTHSTSLKVNGNFKIGQKVVTGNSLILLFYRTTKNSTVFIWTRCAKSRRAWPACLYSY